MTNKLEGKIAIVTGAAGGIGSAYARGLAEAGAAVVVADAAVVRAAAVRPVHLPVRNQSKVNATKGRSFVLRPFIALGARYSVLLMTTGCSGTTGRLMKLASAGVCHTFCVAFW